MATRTEHFPRLAQTRLVPRIKDKHDGMAFVVVFRPDGADVALAAEVEEVHRRGREGDFSDCSEEKVGRARARRGECQRRSMVTVIGNSLFCPTVGPILSGGIPGVGLYSVLIFSSMVCLRVSRVVSPACRPELNGGQPPHVPSCPPVVVSTSCLQLEAHTLSKPMMTTEYSSLRVKYVCKPLKRWYMSNVCG